MGNQIVKQIAKGQSLAADFFSEIIPVGPFVDNIAFNIEAIGVSNNLGVFTVQHRIVKDTLRFSAWGTLCMSTETRLSSKDEVKILYLNQAPIGEIRLVFTTNVGADGTCDIWYSGRNL
jgi:hypothetical protein